MYLIFSTETPTELAAFGFSPTARILRPRLVLYSITLVSAQQMNAIHVSRLCPEMMLPRKGILSISGMLMFGISRFEVIKPVEDAMDVPSDRFVMTLHKNSVPPEPIMLTAMPTSVISVLSWKAKKPIIRLMRTPMASAASNPQTQLCA